MSVRRDTMGRTLALVLGAVAGLVVITPAAGFVSASGAVLIGVLAGVVKDKAGAPVAGALSPPPFGPGAANASPEAQQRAAEALAVIDVSAALAELADDLGYTRPSISSGLEFHIEGGRHPVVEQALRRSGSATVQARSGTASGRPPRRLASTGTPWPKASAATRP